MKKYWPAKYPIYRALLSIISASLLAFSAAATLLIVYIAATTAGILPGHRFGRVLFISYYGSWIIASCYLFTKKSN